jgi:dynein heavy chain
MAGFGIFQVEITKLYGIMEWCEDLKIVLKKAGADNMSTVFLFNDTQLKLEQFLEDINNILNTGEVPNLYPKDEIMPLLDAVRNRAKKVGRDGSIAELYMYFVDQCRTNLHMVIAMSPFGDAFRTRLRMFPSLVNCCTIDWFSEWPEEALSSVATNFVSSMGLEKVFFAEGQVTIMKQELEDLQPILLQTAEDTNKLLAQIDKDTKEAEATRAVVEAEEAIANIKAAEAKAIKDDCEAELDVAMPMLNAALAALDTLTKADITEVKAMKNPPAAVKLVMEACCIMKGVAYRKIPDPNKPGSKMIDYWGPAQQMLADNNFLASLKTYDKDNMSEALMIQIQPYIVDPNFDPAVVKKASKAAYGLCCWIRAMESYDKVNKIVAPKKAKLAAATAEFEELQAALAAKKAILKQVEEKLAELQEQLRQKGEEKAALEAEVLNCENKLTRVAQLINGLGGEKV